MFFVSLVAANAKVLMILNFSSQQRMGLIGGVGLIFLVLYYFAVVLPMKDRGEGLLQRQALLAKKFGKEKNIVEQARSLGTDSQQYFTMFIQEFSEGEQMTAMIAEIESLAKEVGLRFSEVKPGKVNHQEDSNIFSVSLSTEGTTAQITHFLYLLESHPHFFQIDRFHLGKKSAQDKILKASFTVSRLWIVSAEEKEKSSKINN